LQRSFPESSSSQTGSLKSIQPNSQ
jgi:hypothetical protein